MRQIREIAVYLIQSPKVWLSLLLIAVVLVLDQLAPPIDSLPANARVVHGIVITVGVCAALFSTVLISMSRRFDPAAFGIPLLTVFIAACVIRETGLPLERAILTVTTNPTIGVAALVAVMLIAIVTKIGVSMTSRSDYDPLPMVKPAILPADEGEEEELPMTDGWKPGWNENDPPHRYFVTFKMGYGGSFYEDSRYEDKWCASALSSPITDGYRIAALAQGIRQEMKSTYPHRRRLHIIITSWKRLENEEPGPRRRQGIPTGDVSKNVIAFRRTG